MDKLKIRNEKLSQNFIDEKNYYHSDIHELRNKIQNDEWNSNPENYGTDNCFDGSHTIYSLIYPDNTIKSMYMRCWINKELREYHE